MRATVVEPHRFLQFGRAVMLRSFIMAAVREPRLSLRAAARIKRSRQAGGLHEPVRRALPASGALVVGKRLDVGGLLDQGALIVAALIAGDDVLFIGDAQLVKAREHGERFAHLRVRDGIIVAIETDIRRLAGFDFGAFEQGIRLLRARHQLWRFLSESLVDVMALSYGQGRAAAASRPVFGLSVQVIQAGKRAGGEEVVADIADGAFNASLLVAAGHGHGPGLEAVVSGKIDQRQSQ